MTLFPSREQWSGWSLPSKLTAIGTAVGLLSIALTLVSMFRAGTAANVDEADAEAVARQLPPAVLSTLSRVSSTSSSLVPAQTLPNVRDYPALSVLAKDSSEALAALLDDITSSNLTNLQKRAIVDHLDGRTVQCAGYVYEISRIGDEAGSDVLLVMLSTSGRAVVAKFSGKHESALTTLRRNQLVVINGTARFSRRFFASFFAGNDMWDIALDDAKPLVAGDIRVK